MEIAHSKLPHYFLAALECVDDNSSVAYLAEEDEEECDTCNEAVADDNSNSVAALAAPPGDEQHDDSVCSSELGTDCSRPFGWLATEEELPPLPEVRHGHGPS